MRIWQRRSEENWLTQKRKRKEDSEREDYKWVRKEEYEIQDHKMNRKGRVWDGGSKMNKKGRVWERGSKMNRIVPYLDDKIMHKCRDMEAA